jgi:hypothetical protein
MRFHFVLLEMEYLHIKICVAYCLPDSLSLTSATTTQRSSITAKPSEKLNINYSRMPSPVYQNVTSMTARLSIRSPSEFINVADNQVLRCGKVYYSNCIIITNFT